MNIGCIVEYIDQQRIVSAVILSEKKGKLRLLNENSREVNFSEKRLSHISAMSLDTDLSKTALVNHLKHVTENRKRLAETINIPELWDILHDEPEEIGLDAMTLFCFDPPLIPDHEAAVIRAFFDDRLYFKTNQFVFTPCTPEQVESKKRQIKEGERREGLISKGAQWLTLMQSEKICQPTESPDSGVIEILKSYYLQGNDSQFTAVAKQMLKKSGLSAPEQLFNIFVRASLWDVDENIDLLSMQIPTTFPETVLEQAKKLVLTHGNIVKDPQRQDLTDIPLITIDGQSTQDYDDAISLENTENGYRLGIHIIDVAAYIKSGDPIDIAARYRASSIYMPDDKLPMIPPSLSEDLCSLKEGETRPGISTLVQMNRFFEISDFKIVPSIIKVHKQMSYTEANLLNGKNDPITSLYKIATLLREKRLKAGGIQITLPEVNVWLDDNKEIRYAKIDRENPSRMLVSEMMILANSLMAQFLADHNTPAVFRSQAPPRQRLFKGIETALMPNFLQRKQLSRAIIGIIPELHAGLGVKAYVTATSPIRRYHDLLTQRQIRSILGIGKAYSKAELDEILQTIAVPMGNAGRVQGARKRYWLIKHLESMRGSSFETLVLDCHRDYYNILIKELMMEARLPHSGLKLKVGDILQVTIQHADARRNQLSLFAA
jgi:exoribonuclease-2